MISEESISVVVRFKDLTISSHKAQLFLQLINEQYGITIEVLLGRAFIAGLAVIRQYIDEADNNLERLDEYIASARRIPSITEFPQISFEYYCIELAEQNARNLLYICKQLERLAQVNRQTAADICLQAGIQSFYSMFAPTLYGANYWRDLPTECNDRPRDRQPN